MQGYVAQSLMYQEKNVEAETLFRQVLTATEKDLRHKTSEGGASFDWLGRRASSAREKPRGN
jgi:hypothetical protein